MAVLVALALGLAALAFVLYPLYRGAQEKARALSVSVHEEGGEAITLTEREQAARGALREVELDYQLGNIAEREYRALRERYVRRALVAFKSRYDREQELDEEIEAQVRSMREREQDAKEE
jgi:hypothetical protein